MARFLAAFFLVYTVVLVLVIQMDGKARFGHNAIFPRAGNGHTLTRMQEADTVADIDVLVLGSSHAYRSFDPRLFKDKGLRMFNLGTSSQTPIQTKVLIQRYVKQFRPKQIIWAVNPDMFRSDGVESSLDLIANTQWDYNLFGWIWNTLDFRTVNALYYRWLEHFFVDLRQCSQVPKGKYDQYIAGGYVERSQFKEKESKTNPVGGVHLNSKQVGAFEHCVDLLRDTKVWYIETPVTEAYYASYPQREEYRKLFNNKLFVNFNSVKVYSNVHFYDDQHLNTRGVEKFFLDFFPKLTLE